MERARSTCESPNTRLLGDIGDEVSRRKNVIRIVAARARAARREGRTKGETNKSTIGNYACISDERTQRRGGCGAVKSGRVPEEGRTVKIRTP